MKNLIDFIAQFRLLTLFAVAIMIGAVVVLILGGAGHAIFWALVASFLLKLGDRE